jgi:hypothetical protein
MERDHADLFSARIDLPHKLHESPEGCMAHRKARAVMPNESANLQSLMIAGALLGSALVAVVVFAAVVAILRAMVGDTAARRQARMKRLNCLLNGERIERHVL